MTETLIIFVDSLPFVLLPQMSFLDSVAERWPIRPGFGYSVNIHAELFAGLLPDDVGYFGEWMYNPGKAPGRTLKPILPLLDTVFHPYIFNRGLQRLLTLRYHPGHPMPNIPLRHLDKFALEGKHIQSPDFPHPTLFTKFPHLHTLTYRGIGKEKGQRDRYLFEQGIETLTKAPALFVPLPDLDGFGHLYGMDGKPYREHLAAIDDWAQQLSQAFLKQHPSGHVFVISDHGMANVTGGVYLDIEEQVGRTTERTYLYFSDANLLRVWVFEQALYPVIQDYLEHFGHGRILTDEERHEYGLTSHRFGDFIYVLNEGLAFEPSTFARQIPKGMHGYHPDTSTQQGILVHLGPELRETQPQTMRDVYHLMWRALAGTL